MISIAPVEDHREREKGLLVYPVYSRRSGGLSVGINLFPGKKRCSFDCPYCEVFPFSAAAAFSPEQTEKDLRALIAGGRARGQGAAVKDICFSGNGEPTMSADFPEALLLAGRVRKELARDAELVVITNGAFLLDARLFSLLKDAAVNPLKLNIWLKLDAGTEGWYKKINRSSLPLKNIAEKAKEFAAAAPVTVQTMICAVDGAGPPPEEAEAWNRLILDLVEAGAKGKNGGVRKVQIYGKARPAPEDPKASPLPPGVLEERAALLRNVLKADTPPVVVYK